MYKFATQSIICNAKHRCFVSLCCSFAAVGTRRDCAGHCYGSLLLAGIAKRKFEDHVWIDHQLKQLCVATRGLCLVVFSFPGCGCRSLFRKVSTDNDISSSSHIFLRAASALGSVSVHRSQAQRTVRNRSVRSTSLLFFLSSLRLRVVLL